MTPVHKRLAVLGLLIGLGAVLVTAGTRSGEERTVPATMASATTDASGQARTVQWSDLLPDGMSAFRPSDAASDFPEFNTRTAGRATMDELGREVGPMSTASAGKTSAGKNQIDRPDPSAPRLSLDGERVALAGYMTPFNVVEGRTRTFLLVPYVGACIHVPAPPPNQVVLVEAKESVEVREMWDPFQAVGKLQVETVDTGLAEVGYVMELERIEPYDAANGAQELEGVRSAGDGD